MVKKNANNRQNQGNDWESFENSLRFQETNSYKAYKDFLFHFNVYTSLDPKAQNSMVNKLKSVNENETGEEDREDLKNLLDKLLELLKTFKGDKVKRIPYNVVAEFVISILKMEEKADFTAFLSAIDSVLSDIIADRQKYSVDYDAFVCFYKAHEHAILANKQFNAFYIEAMNTSNVLEGKLSRYGEKLNGYEDSLQNYESRMKESSTDIIAILGVFSAFVFVMFGGFSALSEILENLSNKDVSLGSTLLMVSVLSWMILTIVYSLLYWISVFSGRAFVFAKDKKNHALGVFEKHGYYLFLSLILLIIFGVSIYLHSKGI